MAKLTTKTPINRARGEASIEVAGERYKLVLTLASMAEIEDALEIESLAEIQPVLEKGGSRPIAQIVAALARGGGHTLTADDVRRWPLDIATITAAIGAAFSAAGAVAPEDDTQKK